MTSAPSERHTLRRTFTKKFPTLEALRQAERAVRSAFMRLHRDLGRHPKGCPTIAELRDDFLAALRIGYAAPGRSHRTPATSATVDCHVRRLNMFCEEWPEKPLDRIGRSDVESWLLKRTEDVEAATANQDLCTLRMLGAWAMANNRVTEELWVRRVESLPLPERIPGNEKPPRILQRGYAVALLRAFDKIRPDIAAFLRGMILVGLRPAALAKMRVSDVVMPLAHSDGWITIPPIKGGKPEKQEIPFNSKAHKWLEQLKTLRLKLSGRKTDSVSAPLFPCQPATERHRRPAAMNPGGWTTSRFDQAFKRQLDHPEIVKLGYGGVEKEELTPYVFRHVIAEFLADSDGMTPRAVQKFLRHRRITTQDKYLDRDAEAKSDALRAAAEFEEIPRGRAVAKTDRMELEDLLFDMPGDE